MVSKARTVLLIMTMLAAFGGLISGLFENFATWALCGFCQDAAKPLVLSLSGLVTAGQSDINIGVDGILKLDRVDASLRAELYGFYRQKIVFGLVESLLVFGFVYAFWGWFLGVFVNNMKPAIIGNLFLTFVAIGLFSLAMGTVPFSGFFNLLVHPGIWSIKLLNILSPVPLNETAINATVHNNVSY